MCVCEVCLACALSFLIVSRSCLCNLILHIMNTAVSSVNNMQTADKSPVTGKLALSGHLLPYPTTAGELYEVLLVEDTVELVVGS